MDFCKQFSFPSNSRGCCRFPLEVLMKVLIGFFALSSFSVFLLLSVPIYLFRSVIIIYARYFRKDLDEILGGMSSYLVNDYFSNKAPRANIVLQIILKGRVTLEEIKHLVTFHWIGANDIRFKKFCHYPVRWMGFTFYKNATASFHIDNHVHLYIRKEHGINVTENDITEFTEELLNSPFTSFKSPWEVHLVQNYKNEKICSNSEELSVFILKVHHSLTDGFGVIAALVQAFSQQSLTDLKLPQPRYPKRAWFKTIMHCFTVFTNLVLESGHYVIQTWRSNPWKIPDSQKHWHQLSFRSDIIPIEKLHKIRKMFGVSLSSIMYAAVSAAVRQYGPKKNIKHVFDNVLTSTEEILDKKSIFCLHVIPLSGHPMSLTNHVTLTFLNLPTLKYDSSVDRLHDVDFVLKSSRDASCIPRIFPWFICALGCHIYPVSKFILKNRTFSFGVTNFPADILHFEINGKKALTLDCIVGAIDGVAGAGVMIVSYGQYIRVAATAEAALMDREDINKFGNYIVDEIEQLYFRACTK